MVYSQFTYYKIKVPKTKKISKNKIAAQENSSGVLEF
jgi:hypothetical protein